MSLWTGCALEKPEASPDDKSMRSFVRQAREPGTDIECKTISDRAREVEADLSGKIPDP
jgi:hypothetical protein